MPARRDVYVIVGGPFNGRHIPADEVDEDSGFGDADAETQQRMVERRARIIGTREAGDTRFIYVRDIEIAIE